MTSEEFCQVIEIPYKTLNTWIDNGIIRAERVAGRPGRGGFGREFGPEHVARARVLKALLARRVPYAELRNRPDLFAAEYLVIDGRRVRACEDAAAAIGAASKARHRCAVIDLSAIKQA